MKYALVFPGQGSQSLGMLEAMGGEYPQIGETLAEAGAALGWDLAGLVAAGPVELLNRTERTQPVLLACGVAIWRAWQPLAPPPTALAGHSLGEYTALVVAGSLEFAAALRLVSLRGRLMQEAADGAGGAGMAAVIGLDDDAVDTLCRACPAPGWLQPANYNAPGQVVVAGDAVGLQWLRDQGRAHGARKVVELAMSVPSHCALMRPAAQRLAHALEEITLAPPRIPVFHNVDAAPRREPRQIRAALAEQLHRPVRWTQSVRAMRDSGAAAFFECGPGRVLTGLNRRIVEATACLPLEDPQQFRQALVLAKETP